MGKMLESQKRLDSALACPGLTSKHSIESLVEKQLLRSPFDGTEEEFKCTVKKRTDEVSDFLDMLRSASKNNEGSSGSPQRDWKVKQESDQLRVMYREGPPGSPFHTLLCEGYVDGPVDSCLCVSWEATLFKKWWPQYSIPTFKIIFSSSLQKVRVGEEVFLVRVKVPWPVSDREAILHCCEFECFEEDLVIVRMNSVPETKGIDTNLNGSLKNGLPEAEDIVRVDMVGGFALQKVGSGRSYFRGIANMDIKLEFVPPSLINFLSRQLIGNGHKLYSKAVAAVTVGDEDYQQALKGAMYARVRENLYASCRAKAVDKNVSTENGGENVAVETPPNESSISLEIVEEHFDENLAFSGRPRGVLSSTEASWSDVAPEQHDIHDQRIPISPEVQEALCILDKAITIYRDLQSSDSQTHPCGGSENFETRDGMKDVSKREDCASEALRASTSCVESSFVGKSSSKEPTQYSVCVGPINGLGTKLQQNQLDLSTHDTSKPTSKNPSPNETHVSAQTSVLERMSKVFDEVSARTNGSYHSIYGNGELKLKRKDKRTKKFKWCWSFS